MAVAAARLEGRGGRRSEASRVAVGRVGVHGLRLCAHWAVWAVQIEQSDPHPPRSRKRRLIPTRMRIQFRVADRDLRIHPPRVNHFVFVANPGV